MDRLLAIRVFDRLVETGGFSRAADALQMPKSTVTKLIQGLESDLGVRLLDRTTRRVTVTAEGAAYYEHTRRWLADLDDFETALTAGRGLPTGNLRVDTGGSVAAGAVAAAGAEAESSGDGGFAGGRGDCRLGAASMDPGGVPTRARRVRSCAFSAASAAACAWVCRSASRTPASWAVALAARACASATAWLSADCAACA